MPHEFVTLGFMDWFKILCTITGGFIAYSLFIFNYIEKIKKEFSVELAKKVDNTVYVIQYENLVKAIEKLTETIDKLEAKIDRLENKWDSKLDIITRKMKTCELHDTVDIYKI